jgi:hypothetical protein
MIFIKRQNAIPNSMYYVSFFYNRKKREIIITEFIYIYLQTHIRRYFTIFTPTHIYDDIFSMKIIKNSLLA